MKQIYIYLIIAVGVVALLGQITTHIYKQKLLTAKEELATAKQDVDRARTEITILQSEILTIKEDMQKSNTKRIELEELKQESYNNEDVDYQKFLNIKLPDFSKLLINKARN